MAALVLSALLVLMWVPGRAAAQAVYKCTANGAVTYQSSPCPQGAAPKRPTVAELNAARRSQADAALAAPPATTGGLSATAPVATPAPRSAPAAYRCDGRTHCSHMTSCAEARYFLANCPNVAMDGDNDGVPCEMQWCR